MEALNVIQGFFNNGPNYNWYGLYPLISMSWLKCSGKKDLYLEEKKLFLFCRVICGTGCIQEFIFFTWLFQVQLLDSGTHSD